MTGHFRVLAAAAALLMASSGTEAFAQKHGGTLKIYDWDNPPSLSIHEEVTHATLVPMMGVLNNLVMYKQDEPQNSLQSVVPDLAKEWSWNEDGTHLTFRLREGVKWHDGRPFTAKDVQCTWDLLLGRSSEKLRTNPHKAWYQNVEEVTADSDFVATFRLRRPQPALIALLASGFSPVYPCHVSPREMRQHPIGTGPFKFLEFKPKESIKVVRNPDYWKKGRPYLDGIEYPIITNRPTAILAFIAGKLDMTFPFQVTVPLLNDVQSQAPQAICELRTSNGAPTLIMNHTAPPFDNADLRKVMALTLDRKAFIDTLTGGQGKIGAAMMPPPEGVWGMPTDMLQALPGYDPDVQKSRGEARKLMERVGYGPDKRLSLKIGIRNIPFLRDPGIILIDQLKEVYIDGELDPVETSVWFPRIARREYQVGLTGITSGVDDPDQQLYENYSCGSERNYSGYCDRDVEQLIDRQSREADQEKRRRLVWEIDKKLQQDSVRPIIYYGLDATCWQPHVKGLTIMVNSVYNGWRFEDVWLDK
jgi:peptide/nickel transport system substrate-binding protein